MGSEMCIRDSNICVETFLKPTDKTKVYIFEGTEVLPSPWHRVTHRYPLLTANTMFCRWFTNETRRHRCNPNPNPNPDGRGIGVVGLRNCRQIAAFAARVVRRSERGPVRSADQNVVPYTHTLRPIRGRIWRRPNKDLSYCFE